METVIASAAPAQPGFLDRERTIAKPGFNRWLVPPAALAIHLCIGMAYGFSVFWLPLSRAIGISKAVECAKDMGFFEQLVRDQLRLEDLHAGLDVHLVLRSSRFFCCASGAAGWKKPVRARPVSWRHSAGAAAW